MIQGRFAGADGWVLDQNVIFTRDLLELVEQSSLCLARILQDGLMSLQPLVAFCPERPLFHKDRLFLSSCLPRRQFPARDANGAEEPVPNEKIQQPENKPGNHQRKHTLAPVHALDPRRQNLHFDFPSSRNWAWSLGKMRGAAISKRKICSPGFFFTLSANW